MMETPLMMATAAGGYTISQTGEGGLANNKSRGAPTYYFSYFLFQNLNMKF